MLTNTHDDLGETASQTMDDWADGWTIVERHDEPERPFRDYLDGRHATEEEHRART